MKRYPLFLYILVAGILFQPLFSCNKYDHYQTNPNNPSQTTPALLLSDICVKVFDHRSIDQVYSTGLDQAFATRYLAYYERPSVYANYGWGAYGYDNYSILQEVDKMNTLAVDAGDVNYQAIAKVFRAILFSQLTELFGDVPYTEGLQVNAGNSTPKYDAQEDIYAGLLAELEAANDQFDVSGSTLTGDIIYFGNISKWKQLGNVYRLRLLIHLSKKENDTRLNIKQQFQAIVSDASKYPLMGSNDDNAQIVFNKTATTNSYPNFQSNSLQTSISMEQGFVDSLKAFTDPRLFKYAEPVSGLPANAYSSYAGVNEGLTVSDMQTASASASRIANRYWQDQVNEPMMIMGYQEQEFLIAEAITRGWVTSAGTADQHYKNGISASMAFYSVSDTSVQRYLASPRVQLTAANSLQQIAIQKYMSMFLQSYWEPFIEQRRTGIPAFNVGAGTFNNMKVPKRFLYPQTEYNVNKANVDNAVQEQFGGTDDINGEMWLIQ